MKKNELFENGNIGLGTTPPTQKFELFSNPENAKLTIHGHINLVFRDTSPSAKLDVNGRISLKRKLILSYKKLFKWK